jgi:molecular chaperone GrpE
MEEDLKDKGGNGAPEPTAEKAKPKKKSSGSRIAKLKDELLQVKTERDELKDQLLRKAAEFENYRRRTENEFSQVVANANADLIAELLPILDDLDRSVNSSAESLSLDDLRKGIDLIHKNLVKVLDRRGLQAIEAVGQPFDPEKHEALMQMEDKDKPEGCVLDEHLKGYMLNERVLRHSQVLVNK